MAWQARARSDRARVACEVPPVASVADVGPNLAPPRGFAASLGPAASHLDEVKRIDRLLVVAEPHLAALIAPPAVFPGWLASAHAAAFSGTRSAIVRSPSATTRSPVPPVEGSCSRNRLPVPQNSRTVACASCRSRQAVDASCRSAGRDRPAPTVAQTWWELQDHEPFHPRCCSAARRSRSLAVYVRCFMGFFHSLGLTAACPARTGAGHANGPDSNGVEAGPRMVDWSGGAPSATRLAASVLGRSGLRRGGRRSSTSSSR